jgi:hypothetical protein
VATTYTLIDKAILGSNQSSITFSSIPSTFTDLNLVCSTRIAGTGGNAVANLTLRFNGSQNDFTGKAIGGNGSSAYSDPYTTSKMVLTCTTTATSSTFSNNSIYIPNYAGSNYKSFSVDNVIENNATASWIEMDAGLWSQTAAITSITLLDYTLGYDLVSGSSFYLYGIKNS